MFREVMGSVFRQQKQRVDTPAAPLKVCDELDITKDLASEALEGYLIYYRNQLEPFSQGMPQIQDQQVFEAVRLLQENFTMSKAGIVEEWKSKQTALTQPGNAVSTPPDDDTSVRLVELAARVWLMFNINSFNATPGSGLFTSLAVCVAWDNAKSLSDVVSGRWPYSLFLSQ